MAVKEVRTEEVTDVIQVLKDDGTVLDKKREPNIPEAKLKHLYYILSLTRAIDERMLKTQRQGRIGFYMPSSGEEAAHIGSAFALDDNDWIFPQYREPGAALLRGLPIFQFICHCFGNEGDITKGRQMPSHFAYRPGKYMSVSSPIATQLPHAVGFAWGAKIRKEKLVTLTYFGDGGTSTGDFHVAMNFAGVFKTPTIFFCKNNRWAISVPFDRQTASANIAVKGTAYGVEGVRVDGNDLLAVIHVTQQAAAKARSGGGPTLIEAVTYRMGPHSTSDDPRIYANENELGQWKSKDPITRFERYLAQKGIWNEKYGTEIKEKVTAEVAKALEEAEKLPLPSLDSLFDDVYYGIPTHLKEQRDYLRQFNGGVHHA